MGPDRGSAYLAHETQALYKDVGGEAHMSWKLHEPVKTYVHDWFNDTEKPSAVTPDFNGYHGEKR